MHGTLLFSLGLAASTLIFPSVSQAAIAVGVIGATENFDAAISTPGASPSDPSWTWTTSSNAAGVPGSGSNTTVTDPAGMDALVAPIIAGNVSVAIADTAATGTSNSAQRNSNNLNIQTIPTGSAFLIIMGAFQNTSAIAYSGALVSYTHAALNTPNETEVAGYRGYVSIDGTTFTNVPDFNTAPPDPATPSTVAGNVSFGSPVAPGSLFYLLWADDNMNGGTEGMYTFDNFSIIPIPVPEPSLAMLGLMGLVGLVSRRRR
jgi:MYXO-CTERM domain-containing protein